MEDVTFLARACPRCGKALSDRAPEGLCPACLLVAGTETLTSGTIDEGLTVTAQGGAAVPRLDAPQLIEGQTWGSYRIGRLLGRGGMGEVHEAEHLESGRRIALKVLHSRLHDAEDRARFLREGQLAASVSHPHTVYIFGSEEITGVPVITMELVPGGTLKDRVARDGPMSPAIAVSAVLDIIGGLDAAQAAGILHRDIKPSNCFVDSDGSVKVGDFGLSISTLARDVRQQLATGFEGTPPFAAPEQLRGEPLDVRADIYAVGATLYYLLTGQPPFDAADLRTLVARVNTEPARSPRLLRREVPNGLAAVILRCLAKSPAQRPPTYMALAEALRPFGVVFEKPARPGVRFAAAVADLLLLSVPVAVWRAANTEITVVGESTGTIPSPWTWLMNVAYFFVLEARWGASLGKRLFGLQLSSPDGPGWTLRVARRTAVFHLPWLAVALLLVGFGPIGPTVDRQWGRNWRLDASDTREGIEGLITLTLVAMLFVTARRRNGWTGLHDLASGTRVVSRSASHVRKRRAPGSSATLGWPTPAARGPRIGPFAVISEVRNEGDLVVGFDSVLRRQAWIQIRGTHSSAIDPVRRDLSRPGRLHWLTGRRGPTENWDAFEAPDGQPLLTLPPPDWTTLKSWLVDLSAELASSAEDGSTPALRLDRLWIRDDDRLVLLDFPAPGLDAATRAHAGGELTPLALMSAVAAHRVSTSSERVLMPLSAHTMFARWSMSPPELKEAHSELNRIAALPERVSRTRRALPALLASIPTMFLIGLTVLVMLPAMNRFFAPEPNEMLAFLEMLYQPNPAAGSRLADPEVRNAIETYLAGRHGARLRDPNFWDSPVMRGVSARLRKTAEGVAARHPSVAADDLARASAALAPELEPRRQRRDRNLSELSPIIIMNVAAIALLPVMLLTLLSSLVVPGGVVTRLLGNAVIRGDGREIDRGLSLSRALVAWAPAITWFVYLAASPKVQGIVPTPPNPLLGMAMTLGALALGAALTIARPSRGPHDWLLGTWVVPR
jgi:eukaryotic-like serine/threonine-protein kinase